MPEQLRDLPDPNLFMLCGRVDTSAFREMPEGFSVRLCRREELGLWKRMHFDDEDTAARHMGFMDQYFSLVYAPKGNLFFETCLFAVDGSDAPVGTCFAWKAYGAVTTLAWFKVVRAYEGRGIGRALLTRVMRGIAPKEYPVLLHTQPSSDRAIKLYTDFGFHLITDDRVGQRTNDLKQCLPILKAAMPGRDFERLRFSAAPEELLKRLSGQSLNEF